MVELEAQTIRSKFESTTGFTLFSESTYQLSKYFTHPFKCHWYVGVNGLKCLQGNCFCLVHFHCFSIASHLISSSRNNKIQAFFFLLIFLIVIWKYEYPVTHFDLFSCCCWLISNHYGQLSAMIMPYLFYKKEKAL